VQETRGFDESTGKTFSQRIKEDSHDYRYFPDPDLPKLFISEIPEFQSENIILPELPWEKRARYKAVFGMKDEDAEMFVQNEMFRTFFENICRELDIKDIVDKDHAELARLAINYSTSDIAGLVKKNNSTNILISPTNFAELIKMIKSGELSSRSAKDILTMVWEGNTDSPKIIAEKHGMVQKNDPEALEKMIQELMVAHPHVVAYFKAGKQVALQLFVGQIMKLTKGAVNPQMAQEKIKNLLSH
jgi:aspartyl-tRNA(Asn)/glutamyl-tRNA(Gln) amidotransferase subunit B